MNAMKNPKKSVSNLKSESKIQQEIVKYYRNTYCLKHHKYRCMIFSIPNESSQGNAIPLIQTGLYSGAADLCVVHNYNTLENRLGINSLMLFIETKDAKGKQKPKQKMFEEHCIQMGIPYHIVRSLEEFKDVILKL